MIKYVGENKGFLGSFLAMQRLRDIEGDSIETSNERQINWREI